MHMMETMKVRGTVMTVMGALMLLFILPASGQSVELHPRVGSTLEPAERAYFDLFRTWPEGVVEVHQAPANGVHFQLNGVQTRSLTLSAEAVASVRTYLDRYEDSAFLRDSLDWQNVATVGRFGNRFRPPSMTKYAGVDGTRLEGTLLHISNDKLVTLVGTPQYRWDHVQTSARQVDATSLARVERGRPMWAVSNRLLLGLGMVFGSMIAVEPELISSPPYAGDALSIASIASVSYGIFQWATSTRKFAVAGQPDNFRAALSGLENYTAFSDNAVPPELSDATVAGLDPLFPDDGQRASAAWEPARYVSFGSEFLFSLSEIDSFIGTGFGLLPAERRQAPFLRIGVSQDRNRSMGYGIEALVSLPTAAKENQVDYSGQLLTVYASWYAARPDYLSFSNRWSLSAGAGVLAGRLASTAPVEFTPQITGLDPSLAGVDRIGQSQFTVAGQLRLAAGYAIDESSLLELRVTALVPPISLEKEERTFISSTLYTLDAVSMPLGVSLAFKKRMVRGR